MRHAQVCLGEIPLRLKMRKAHSADVMDLETHQRDAGAANRALELLGRDPHDHEGHDVQWSRAGMPRSMRCVSQATASSAVAKISFWST